MRTARNIFLTVVIGWVAVSCQPSGPDRLPAGPRPNVIIILVDALRADGLGCYGNTKGTSPFLDSWARKGVVFAQAFSHASHTKLSVATVFTGLLPPHNGIRKAAEAAEVLTSPKPTSDVLAPGLTTMAELFARNGYRTYGLITNPHILGNMGFGQGFAEYRYLDGGPRALTVNEVAEDWFFRHREAGPFFVYLHYMDVHAPYQAPEEYQAMFTRGLVRSEFSWDNGPYPGKVTKAQVAYLRAQYDAQVRYWDDQFKKLMAALADQGVLDNTIVVVLADHGEEFHEHGGFGHGYTVYDEMLHVPLIMVWPGRIPAGLARKDPVRLVDLFPTLAGLCRLDVSGLALDGRDLFAKGWSGTGLLSFLRGDQAPPDYAETYQGKAPRCLRSANAKLIFNQSDQSTEFYDLARDPDEQKSVTDDSAAALLLPELRCLSNERPRSPSAPPVELDQQTVRELRSLGYVKP